MFRTGITCVLFSPEPDYISLIQLKALVLGHEVAGDLNMGTLRRTI
jgi:hypothetical protein